MANEIENVDLLAPANANETARQRFVSTLRKVVLVDVGRAMQQTYEASIDAMSPADSSPQTGDDVRRFMQDRSIYRFFSAARMTAQEMVYESVRPQIERNAHRLIDAARHARAQNPAGGSLTLDPSLQIPRYLDALDVHRMPGCFHTEYTADDVLQGAVNAYGNPVFRGGLKQPRSGGPGASIAHFLRYRYPDFMPARILDLGCTIGRNTLPYAGVFSQAEIHGVDVAAPVLRYAHARAEALGTCVHFSQQNAAAMNFPDGSFDFITSSYFLHELPIEVTRSVFAECHRLLRPGGLMLHFELPPRRAVGAYSNFYLDWDTYYNNEPSYARYRAEEPRELCRAAGFDDDAYIEQQIYNWGSVPAEKFVAASRGESDVPIIGHGGSWFTYGAFK